MKNLSILVLTVMMAFAFTNPVEDNTTVSVDIEQSTVTWKGYKVTGSHEGTIQIKSGALDYNDDRLTGGSFEIDMTTINCTDLEGEYKGKLEGHLKSDDFFGVANYPTAKFEITKVASQGTPGDYKVTGNLTIKEITKEVKFFTNITDGVATAKMTIDRSDFDVRYGSGSFFDSLGDKTIYDEFELDVKLALVQ